MNTDVVIIGKGIAGLALSFLLNKQQIPHILLARQEEPKQMPLAETLPPSALPLLQKMGLLPLFEQHALRKTSGYHACWGSQQVINHNFYFQRPFQYGLKLDKQALIQSFTHSQNKYIQTYSPGFDIEKTANGFTINIQVKGQPLSIRSKIVVDATGRNRAALKHLSTSEIESQDDLMAFSCILPKVKLPQLPHGVFVESFEQGWGIVSELADDRQVMSLFTHKANPQLKQFTRYKSWLPLLANTQWLKKFLTMSHQTTVMGKDASSHKPLQVADYQWLTIGDAAMALDPLSSHGITSALFTCHKASETLVAYLQTAQASCFTDYNQSIQDIFQGYIQAQQNKYQQERRWKNNAFWESRQRVLIEEE